MRALLLATLAFTTPAHAAPCDYTFSRLAAKTTAALTGGNGLTGAGAASLGYYTLAHAGTGVKMLGAAETAGLISGAGRLASSVGAVLMAPATLVAGGIAIIGMGSFEGYCYFQVQRITDPYEVREVIESIAQHDPAVTIVPTDDGPAMALNTGDDTKTYLLRKLNIADGQLKHRDLLLNTNLGPVAFTAPEVSE
jgi:hypothetical protein